MSTDLTNSETDGTAFGGISEYTGSSTDDANVLSVVFDDLLDLPQHLCDNRQPNRRPTMRVDSERNKCEAISTGMSITGMESVPVCDDYTKSKP